MPTALHMLGLSTSDAAFGTIVVNGAFILFSFPISFLLPRVQLRKLLLGMFTVGTLVSLGLGLAGSQWTVIFVLIALAGLGIGGQQLVLNYLVAGTYSAELRGVATGFSIGVGRARIDRGLRAGRNSSGGLRPERLLRRPRCPLGHRGHRNGAGPGTEGALLPLSGSANSQSSPSPDWDLEKTRRFVTSSVPQRGRHHRKCARARIRVGLVATTE